MTPAQLLDALAAVRHYADHSKGCESRFTWRQEHYCNCGLDDVLRGIDAMLAGRNTGNHPEVPEGSKESDDGN